MRTILRVYDKNQPEEWNNCVKTFKVWDIYYLYEYAYSFMLHGDGDIFLIYFENKEDRFCYVVMKKDISDDHKFSGVLSKGKYYDLETPYGYGGPLCDSEISEESQDMFREEMFKYCSDNNIISQFVRFHPVLKNHKVLSKIIETKYMRDTIYIDTSDVDLIMENMDSKNRNMVRKGIKNNISIECKDITDIEGFIPIYTGTMTNKCADDYYIFQDDYFKYLSNIKENACVFYALYEGRIIGGSIMFFNDRYMHYHLSGSDIEYRKYSPNNLLLYEAACWASKKGIKQFHLGGGLSPNDSLFGYKKQFNKNGALEFYIGRTIFNKAAYDELMTTRKKVDELFDVNNGFMIQYRA